MRHHNLELDMILRGIVMTRGEEGATICEMRADYFKIVGEKWPLYRMKTDKIVQYLMEIDGLMMEKQESGLCIWWIDDIGSSMNSREFDSNNNVIVIEDSTVANTTNSHAAMTNNNSYAIPAAQRRMANSSFVSETHAQHVSATSSDLLHIEPIENGNDKNRKRNLSQDRNNNDNNKRPRLLPENGLLLNEQNLHIHNRNNGPNLIDKKITSTEIENSISIHDDADGNDYVAPIKETANKQLQQEFSKQCRINGKPDFNQMESIMSNLTIGENVFPPVIGVIGDDFMRSMLGYELHGFDFVDNNEKKLSYCFSGQTVGEAYSLVLDKQYNFRAKYQYIIVNVGAIDILLERNIITIMAEYARLIKAITTIGLDVIITTVPNIRINTGKPNYKVIYQTLLLFNQFLMDTYSQGYLFIDLHLQLTKANDKLPVLYYHNQPKTITKGKQKLELWCWTALGRKKILNTIDQFIETLPREVIHSSI
ncbi:uncharacterized protein LOC116342729 [Contarinia nasturtii]|uniref:uncharacterized protein LOC116342729 n=1 Tax=Contarinia nasturtii TaxID=265458 RepID=UPI0012D48F52|nr:uncharacterized protein LOC116342729 [Contarinia nasturtii]